ncbi:NFYB/HAP3 family transcription factor subunit [Candidatus Woesearchaeota archaeon]|nr:NFYB/HAP3 family transcription factor subunit [Candidatus Woesearchaeota archaeon]
MDDKLLPLAAMEKLMKKVGAASGIEELRVSEDAKAVLKELLEHRGNAIAAQAVRLAGHARRDTVKKRDIVLAAKMAT